MTEDRRSTRRKGNQPSSRKASRAGKPASGARRPRPGITVMLVDDHPMWRHTIREILEGRGLARVVAEASDGEGAVRLATDTRPDLVLMDINMPGLDGIEATRRLLTDVPGIKILALSASDSRNDVAGAIRAGVSGYLLKVAGPDEVLDAVRRVAEGEMVFPPSVADLAFAAMREPATAPTETLRVAIADASALFRDGLARILEDLGHTVLSKAGRARELLTVMDVEPPDAVVIDIKLDDAVETARELTTTHPDVGVLLLSEEVDVSSAVSVIKERSRGIGYLLKARVADATQLSDALARVARGDSVIEPEVAGRLVGSRGERDPLDRLTKREMEVLGLMAEGLSNRGISERLVLSAKAVEGHVRNIFSKLGLEPTNDDHRRVRAVITYLRSM